MNRFPASFSFNDREEFFLLLGNDGFMNIQLELRVSGSLDEQRLRRAIAAAVDAHPKTRARMVARRRLMRPPLWELGEPDLGGILSTTTCDGESQLAEARVTFYNQDIDLGTAPALRFLLVRRPGGDSLFLNVHHAVADGIGATRFFLSVARAYGGRPDPVLSLDPFMVRDETSFGRPTSRGSRWASGPGLPPGRRAFIAPEGAADATGHAGFLHLALSGEQSRRLNPRRLVPNATVNDLLLASLHQAVARWNAGRDRPCGCIALGMPINIRPPGWRYEVVAGLSRMGRVASTPEERLTSESLMAAVVSQTQQIKQGRGVVFQPPTWYSRLLPFSLLLVTILGGDRGRVTAGLSNLGRLEDGFDFGFGPMEVTEFWFSPPTVRKRMGLALGATSLNGRLHLVLRYDRALFDDEAARRFSGLLLECLFELGDAPDSPSPGERSRQSVSSA